MGITLSLWEVFTLFEQLNAGPRTKMFFEPARYHAVMFSAFFELIANRAYQRGEIAEPQTVPVRQSRAAS